MTDVTINVTFSDEEAFCLSDYGRRANSEHDAYVMLYAGEKVREALRKKIVTPRARISRDFLRTLDKACDQWRFIISAP